MANNRRLDEIDITKQKSYDDDDYVERKPKKKISPAEKKRREKERQAKAKKKRRIKIAILATEIIMILGLCFALMMLLIPNSKSWLASTAVGKFFFKSALSEESFNKIHDDKFDRTDLGINDDTNTDKADKYTNYAVFGVDARSEGDFAEGANSDCIIVVSINNTTGKVKMASIYRDTFTRIYDGRTGGASYNKINAAFCYGGANSAVKTLNTDFDLNIKDYVALNFDGLAEVIDAMGGLDLHVTDDEIYWMNVHIKSYLKETGRSDEIEKNLFKRKGNDTEQHLNGIQCTAYSRIRYVTFYSYDGEQINNDFGRAARQRYVINMMIDRAKFLGVNECLKIADEIFQKEDKIFMTSIPYDTVIDLIPTMLEFKLDSASGYPTKFVDYNDPQIGSALAPITLESMSRDMHLFLFNDEDYEPSATVKGISEAICSRAEIDEEVIDKSTEVTGEDTEIEE